MTNSLANKHYGLYFPYMQFRNDSWLKLSLLYWENLARIIPPGSNQEAMHGESDTVRLLREESDFLDDLTPEAEVEEIPGSFYQLLQDFGLELFGRYRALDGQAGLVQLSLGELSPRLQHSLIENGLAVDCIDEPGKVLVHPHLATVYMTSLAHEVASRHGLHPVTDSRRDFVAIGGATVKEMAQVLLAEENVLVDEASTVEGTASRRVGYMAVETILPRNLTALPLQALVNFRISFGKELGLFRDTLAHLARGASQITDPGDENAVANHLDQLFNDGLARALTLLAAHLDQWEIETVPGTLAIQVPLPDAPDDAAPAPSNRIITTPQQAVAFTVLQLPPLTPPERGPVFPTTPPAYLISAQEWEKPERFLRKVAEYAGVLALR